MARVTERELRAVLGKIVPEFGTGMVRLPMMEAFIEFHLENPHVYDELVKLARDAKAINHAPGVGCLAEVVRYRSRVKINNNFRAYYARVIAAREPELRNYFEFRDLRSIK